MGKLVGGNKDSNVNICEHDLDSRNQNQTDKVMEISSSILHSSNRVEDFIIEDSLSPIIGRITKEKGTSTDSSGFKTMYHQMKQVSSVQAS